MELEHAGFDPLESIYKLNLENEDKLKIENEHKIEEKLELKIEEKLELGPSENANKLKLQLLEELANVKSGKDRKPCDQCDFKCTTNQELNRHKQIKHEGVRFKCDQCDSVHQYAQGLRNHKRSSHEGVRYSCPECDSKYSHPQALRILMNRITLVTFVSYPLMLYLLMSIQFLICV